MKSIADRWKMDPAVRLVWKVPTGFGIGVDATPSEELIVPHEKHRNGRCREVSNDKLQREPESNPGAVGIRNVRGRSIRISE